MVAKAGMTPGSGILQSFHDLSSTGAAASSGDTVEQGAGAGFDRVCIYCHAPHHTLKPADALVGDGAGGVDYTGANSVGYVPLWNHWITQQAFTLYDNGPDDPLDPAHFADSTILASSPGSVSLLCLSCHDGSVATNEYGFTPAQAVEKRQGAQRYLAITAPRAVIGGGGDLSNHHPIGFDYLLVSSATGGNDDEIADPLNAMGTTGYTIGDLLWNNKMECSTCHDVHNTKNQGRKFTWVEDTNSAFCLTCHLKGI
jgi:predicted CXXCH cytochrome family protein